MTTIAETGAEWLVIAALCDCGYVALSIMATDMCDPHASAEAEHDEQVVAYGDDWRALARLTATALHNTTGLPISAMCTVVYTKDSDEARKHGKLSPFEDEVTEFIYAELDNRSRPKGKLRR